MTEPGSSVQSSSEPIVIFPMRKTRPPRFERLWSGHAGGETKITLSAITVAGMRYARNSSRTCWRFGDRTIRRGCADRQACLTIVCPGARAPHL